VTRAVKQLKQPAGAPLTADVQEKVVPDADAPRSLTGVNIVRPKHVDAGGHVANDIVHEGHVFHDRPGRMAVLIPGCEKNRKAILRVGPVVLEQVAVNEHASGVLELEKILHAPCDTLKAAVADLPGERLRHVITHD